MPVTAIVRVSWQSSTTANQDTNLALVGDRQDPTGSGPFMRVNTAVYSCVDADEAAVANALNSLAEVIVSRPQELDFLGISLTRTGQTGTPEA